MMDDKDHIKELEEEVGWLHTTIEDVRMAMREKVHELSRLRAQIELRDGELASLRSQIVNKEME